MEEKIRSAIWARLLRILEGDSELDAKTLKDCAAVFTQTAAQSGAASDTEECGVIILPQTLPEEKKEAPRKEEVKDQA